MSGENRAWTAGVARGGLRLLEFPYSLAVSWRNRRHDRRAPRRISCPVVSVGNLTVGGTGKTPLVSWLAEKLQGAGRRPAIVSRGYRGRPGELNDEGRELARRLPSIPQVQSADRYAAAQEAIAAHGADLLILDDGFQHRRLFRDLDIVVIDALCPWGYDHLLPRGLLREPVGSLARAGAIVLTRSHTVDAATCDAIRCRAARIAPGASWCTAAERPEQLVDAEGTAAPLAELAGCRIAAFCGIGNPRGFRATLAALAAHVGDMAEASFDLCGFRAFSDHYHYGESDLARLVEWAAAIGADRFLCTEKDLVKIPHTELDRFPLHALRIGIELDPQNELVECVMRCAVAD